MGEWGWLGRSAWARLSSVVLHWQTNIIMWRAVHHVSIIDAGPTPEFRSRAPHFEVGACFHFHM